MGNCAENTAKKMSISREEQDEYAIESYRRAANAWKAGAFKDEIAAVTIKDKKGDIVVAEDEEYKNIKLEKVSTLRPVFDKNGTVTAANASTLNDGASAVVLASKEATDKIGAKPLAKIVCALSVSMCALSLLHHTLSGTLTFFRYWIDCFDSFCGCRLCPD